MSRYDPDFLRAAVYLRDHHGVYNLTSLFLMSPNINRYWIIPRWGIGIQLVDEILVPNTSDVSSEWVELR